MGMLIFQVGLQFGIQEVAPGRLCQVSYSEALSGLFESQAVDASTGGTLMLFQAGTLCPLCLGT